MDLSSRDVIVCFVRETIGAEMRSTTRYALVVRISG